MAGKREAQLGIAVGKKGVGKTYTTLQIISNYLKGNPKTGAKPRKVLILDVNNEYQNVKKDHANVNFPDIKAIALQDVPRFTYHPKIEARRVSTLKPEGGKMSLDEIQKALSFILANYQNGLLLIEDINKFISDSLPNDLMGSIATQRHVSVDVIIHFQTIGKAAHPKLWGNCNWIRYHKCEDTVLRHKSKFAGNVDHLLLLEKLVDIEVKKGNNRFYAYLDKDYGKIKGNFSKKMFQTMIEQYLEENDSIVTKEVRRRNIYSGELIYKSQKEAADAIVKKYFDEYYGN